MVFVVRYCFGAHQYIAVFYSRKEIRYNPMKEDKVLLEYLPAESSEAEADLWEFGKLLRDQEIMYGRLGEALEMNEPGQAKLYRSAKLIEERLNRKAEELMQKSLRSDYELGLTEAAEITQVVTELDFYRRSALEKGADGRISPGEIEELLDWEYRANQEDS